MSRIPGDEPTTQQASAPWSFASSRKSVLSSWGRNKDAPAPLVSDQFRGKSFSTIAERRSSDLGLEIGPPPATLEDLEELREAIKLQSQQAKDNAVTEAKEYADQHIKLLEFSLKDMVLSSGDQMKESLHHHDARIDDVKSYVEKMFGKLTQQVDMLEQQLKGLTLQVIPATNKQIEGVNEQLQSLSADIFHKLEVASKSFTERSNANVAAIGSVNDVLIGYIEEQREEASAVNNRFAELQKSDEGLQLQLASEVEELRSSLGQLHQEMEGSIADLGSKADSRLIAVEQRTVELSSQSSQILSMPVRRVEWVVRDASQFLEDAYRASIKSWASRQDYELVGGEALDATPWRCWFSPEFEASGANGLQLELQVLSSLRHCSQKHENSDGNNSSNTESNDCILRLWAPKGVYLHFKLHVGGEVMELQHEFDGEAPCAMKRCLLSDALDALADVLHFGVDVLEVFQGFDRPTVNLSSARGNIAIDDSISTSENTCGDNPRGSLRLYNHMCPGSSVHLGKIEAQLNLVKSRLIGRVEWVLQDAALMPELFAQGEYLCSPVFTASGAEGLQLIFFPSGEAGATACWCSLYLYYPGKTQLQCWLWVGKQRREITHAPKDRPGFFGRVNFAIYQMVIDHASDSLTLAVEICDVQTCGNEVVAYEPAPRAVPWPQRISSYDAPPGGFPKFLENLSYNDDTHTDDQLCSMNQPQVLEHTSRLYGRAGRFAFHDVKILPSIFSVVKPQVQPPQGPDGVWSFQPKHISSGTPDGYFRCNDLRPPRQEAKPCDSMQPPRAATSHGNDLAPVRRTPCSPRPNSEPLFNRDPSPYSRPLPKLPKDAPSNLSNRAKHRGRFGAHSRGAPPKSGSVSPAIRSEVPLTPRAASACDASPTSDALLANCD